MLLLSSYEMDSRITLVQILNMAPCTSIQTWKSMNTSVLHLTNIGK